jgi:ubiquinone/menaquinone biosynthesis C-methylase UbiE
MIAMPQLRETLNGNAARWQLDARSARAYGQRLVPLLFEAWAKDLVARAGLQSGERILDLACGTGVVAALAATRGPESKVFAVDLNPHMVELARAHCRRAGVEVTCRIGNAAQVPLAGGSLDVVLCQQGLQFFDDRPGVVREMARVLREGGRVLASVWRAPAFNPWARALIAQLEQHSRPELAAAFSRPFSLTSTEEIRGIFQAAEFKNVTAIPVRLDLAISDAEGFIRAILASLPGLSGTARGLSSAAQHAAESLKHYREAEIYRIPSEVILLEATKHGTRT